MDIDKSRIQRRTRRRAAPDHDDRPYGVDRENVLDLLVVLEDERRYYAAAAVMAQDPVEAGRCRDAAQEATALLADVRHGLARIDRRRLSSRERARQMERYARRLMVPSQRAHRHSLSVVPNRHGAS